jgi:hypothetical protein
LFLFSKCAKTHVQASAISKNFPGGYTPGPTEGGGEWVLEGRRGIGGEGIEIREGRKE